MSVGRGRAVVSSTASYELILSKLSLENGFAHQYPNFTSTTQKKQETCEK